MMDAPPAALWPPRAVSAPLDSPLVGGGATGVLARPHGLASENGLLMAAGEGLLSLAPAFGHPGDVAVLDQRGGGIAVGGGARRGVPHVGERVLMHQPSLPVPRLGPQAQPLMPGWVSPAAASGYPGCAISDRLPSASMGLPMDVSASGPFTQLVAVARGQLGEVGSVPLPVARTPTVFSFDWRGAPQQPDQSLQRTQTAWPSQDRRDHALLHPHQQVQDRLTPELETVGGQFHEDKNLFTSPSWMPAFHTSHAASMITPEFSSSAWDGGGRGIKSEAWGDGSATTLMASSSPYTLQSPPDFRNAHLKVPGAFGATQASEPHASLGVTSSASPDGIHAQWLRSPSVLTKGVDLFTTPAERERQAEASLDIASRTAVDEELLRSLARGKPLDPQSSSASSTPTKPSQPLSMVVPPSKTVVVPGLSLNRAPQYRRMCLADILNDSDSRENTNAKRGPRKPRKHGAGWKQQPAHKPTFVPVGAISKRAESVANFQRRLLPKPNAAAVPDVPPSRLSPHFGRIGDSTPRAGFPADPSLQPVISRTQPSFPPKKSQKRPRQPRPPRAKPAASHSRWKAVAALTVPLSNGSKRGVSLPVQGRPPSCLNSAPAPLQSNTAADADPRAPTPSVPAFDQTAGAPIRVEASSRVETSAKKRRRNEATQTQRMRLAARMMEEALRGVGAGGPSGPGGHPTQPLGATDSQRTVVDSSAVIDNRLQQKGFEVAGRTAGRTQSASYLESVQMPDPGVAGSFSLGAVSAELPPTAATSTVVVFCKRDFMRYQAAKLWRKYQEQQQKQEWRPVRVEGKRTRYLNPKYDVLIHKVRS